MGLFDFIGHKGSDNTSAEVSSQGSAPLVPTAAQIAQNTMPGTQLRKVLIVEDEQMLADALTLQLKHDGFEVYHAENGEVGLSMAQSQKPDIILLDLMMPVMDGKSMLRRLREIPEFKTLPVIVLTNAGDIENIRETKTYDNAAAFLIKSNVSTQEISDTVKAAIRGAI